MSARSSRPAPPATAVAEGGQYVTLGVDGDRYAAPVSRVREILDLRPIARLPRAPAELLGVIDVRGRSIPVVDLRCLLGLPPGLDDVQTRILVLHVGRRGDDGGGPTTVGLKADRVFEVAPLDDDALEAPPDGGARWRLEAVAGVARRNGAFVTVLDLDRLLDGAITAAADLAPSAATA